jgi:plasmid stabilization system protein ParE
MTYRVVFTPRAREDAMEAFLWLAERSPDAATRWYEGLENAVSSLSKYPKRNPIAEEESDILGLEIRQKLHGRRRGIYRILFTIEGDTVFLLYVRHSALGKIEPDDQNRI